MVNLKNLILPLIGLILLIGCGTEPTPTYQLTTSVTPTDGGTIVISPNTNIIEEGISVSLRGEPNEGYIFSQWKGDIESSVNPLTFTMDNDLSIIGEFEVKSYPLTINIEGEGSVKEEVIQTKSTDYDYGTMVRLTAIPDVGWNFNGWSGDSFSDESTITITILDETNLSVNFYQPAFFVGENGVTIICNNANIGDSASINGITYTKRNKEQLTPDNFSDSCTSGITNMGYLLWNTDFNGDISHWDVSSVVSMRGMFEESRFNQDISHWDVSNVTDMYAMFSGSEFNHPIDDWNVSSVVDMRYMFSNSVYNHSLISWDVSSVEVMTDMFRASMFNQIIDEWDVSSVFIFNGMFRESKYNRPLNNWNISDSLSLDMSYMFWDSQFNQPIDDWNVSSVLWMTSMFGRSNFNQSIGNWDVSSVTRMDGMFRYNESFQQSIGGWNVASVENMNAMFLESTRFNKDLTNWCVSKITSEPQQFSVGSRLTNDNKPKWGTCPSN